MKALLSENGLSFEYLDVAEGMREFKIFLKLRETRPEFDRIKSAGGLGFPCVVVNNGETILFGDLDLEHLKKLVTE